MNGYKFVGALLGWKRQPTPNGIILTLHVLRPEASASGREQDNIAVALNDRQICSLIRDLHRAAAQRGLAVRAKPKWWQRVLIRT